MKKSSRCFGPESLYSYVAIIVVRDREGNKKKSYSNKSDLSRSNQDKYQ
jgi:hypothetical protein